MEKIRSTLRAAERSANAGAITKEFVDAFVDKIIATPVDGRTMRLDVKIFTGEVTSKIPRKTRASYGSHVQEDDRGLRERHEVSSLQRARRGYLRGALLLPYGARKRHCTNCRLLLYNDCL